MKVYIAAPWVCKEEALKTQNLFEANGVEVTSHWIKYHPDFNASPDGSGGNNEEKLREQAIEDLTDIVRADAFVILNLEKSEGKSFEMGFAYALTIPIILVGEKERNIFYNLPSIVQTSSVEEALEMVKGLGEMVDG